MKTSSLSICDLFLLILELQIALCKQLFPLCHFVEPVFLKPLISHCNSSMKHGRIVNSQNNIIVFELSSVVMTWFPDYLMFMFLLIVWSLQQIITSWIKKIANMSKLTSRFVSCLFFWINRLCRFMIILLYSGLKH